jgi:hypothetical protein
MSSYAFSYYGADTVDSAQSSAAGTRDRGFDRQFRLGPGAHANQTVNWSRLARQ